MRELEAQISADTFQTKLLPFTEADASGFASDFASGFADPAGLIDLADYVHAVPPATVSLTNSPGCTPAGPIAQQSETTSMLSGTDDHAQGRRDLRVRPMRTVRVDAWATPASASWGRTRPTVRKVNNQRTRATSRASAARSTDWGLPF